jgi:uncharacterized sulfatase
VKIRKGTVSSTAALLLLAVACGLALLPGCGSPRQDSSKKYNVVIIVSDAMRQDVLGCYGGEARTPNIDWLAANGVVFENAYSTSPWTAPSSVSMFTGNFATSYGFSPFRETIKIFVPDSEILFAETLKELGYRTLFQCENPHAEMHNNLQGIDEIKQENEYTRNNPIPHFDQIKTITGDDGFRHIGYRDALVFLSSIMTIPDGESFFALHWMIDPHEPYIPPPKFRTIADSGQTDPGASRTIPLARSNWTREMKREHYPFLYRGEVESVDERVGYILDVLRHRGLMEDTYVIFTSDHGERFGEHGRWGHGGFGKGCDFYDTLVKIPLIIAGPDLPRGHRMRHPVSHVDLMPTLQDLLGVEYDNDMQGSSYKSLISKDSSRKRILYFDDVRKHDHVDALLEGSHKLIRSEENSFELYDLSSDPREEHNLVSSLPDLVESMFERIAALRTENEQRRVQNIAAVDSNATQIPDKEKKQLIKQLKALGYID